MTTKPRLLVLDDYEGRMALAPAMSRIRELADVTVRDRPLAPEDRASLADVRVLLAIRERTRLEGNFFDRFPNLELVLQTGGHAYHLDEPAATQRGITVALGRRARTPTVAVPELTFGLMRLGRGATRRSAGRRRSGRFCNRAAPGGKPPAHTGERRSYPTYRLEG